MDNTPDFLAKGSFGSVHRTTKGLVVKKIPYDRGRSLFLLELSIMTSYRHTYINSAEKISWHSTEIRIYQEEALCDLREYLLTRQIRHYLVKNWCAQLFAALAILHRDRIVHCDIKPRNILVTSDLTIKLADFGLAMRQTDTLVTREPSGTRGYLAPETLFSGIQTTQSDIWSAGAVCCEILLREPLIPLQTSTKTNRESKNISIRCKTIKAIQEWREGLGDDVDPRMECTNYIPITVKVPDTPIGILIKEVTRWDPGRRPTAAAILNQPIFTTLDIEQFRSRHDVTLPDFAKHPLTEYLKKRQLTRIDTAVLNEAVILYSRVRRKLIKTDDTVVIEAVLEIASNIYRYTIPGCVWTQPAEVIAVTVRIISELVDYRIHST